MNAARYRAARAVARRVAATRKVLRERMGCTLTDEEFDNGPDVLANIYAMAAEKMHSGRGATRSGQGHAA
ncbi:MULTISPECIES: hypothetical protein [unclassified Streptomyces]|uniref:hypothetical protein n=1 Tax=unclassified Streptomyces TaxID=2593676 RepID=UPI002E7745D7|nr:MULTISPECIES: hypothetical protein [unclassified Streptomyces]MEE1761985.1 hypothetical protein [Streptomyces sp. SP18BB07]MEE1835479.1 hypothetical protein [Streptomyces sp. SP17KL33]